MWVPPTLDMEEAVQRIKTHDDITTARLIFPYWWAWCVVNRSQPALVYDLNCNSGYGCRIIAEQQKHEPFKIVGCDNNEEYVKHAREFYAERKRVEFQYLNLQVDFAAQFHSVLPDVIILFNTLDRLRHRDLVLLGLVDYMKADGTLLLAFDETNSHHSSRGRKSEHSITYGRDDLSRLLPRFFEKVYWWIDDDFPSQDFVTDVREASCKDAPQSHYTHLFGPNLVACHNPIKKVNRK